MKVSPALPRLLFWGAATFAFVMAVVPHPPEVPGSPSDKVQHIVAFATLGLLGEWAYRGASWLRLVLGLSLFGGFIELVQAIPALHRDSDIVDWLADTTAAAVVVLVLDRRRSRSKQRQ